MSKVTIGEFLDNSYLKATKYNHEREGVKLLLLEYLDYSDSDLLLNKDKELENSDLVKLNMLIDDYVIKNIPPQYILGYAYFYGMKLKVNPSVLIPRFDTEVLVDVVLNNIKGNERIIDVGSGSGAISLAIKKERPNVIMSGVDISLEALDVSNSNKEALGLDIEYYQSDLLSNTFIYDVIVSNPPYIKEGDKISDLVYQNEPHLALFAKENGLYFYRRILKDANLHLKEGGKIFFEIGYDQKEGIEKLVKEIMPEKKVEFFKDYGGRFRVAYIH